MAQREKEVKPDAAFLGCLVALYLVVFVGYLGLRRGLTVYAVLEYPKAALPAWAFGPLWAFLSLLLGYVFWRLWTAEKSAARNVALSLFGGQLALHSLWLWLLFGLEKPVGALYTVGFLLVVAIAMYVAGHRARAATAVLLVPYLVWLCYAGYLNYGLWTLNYRAGAGHIETIVNPP